MRDFVKVKIVKCTEGQKYKEIVGDHGMAYSVPESKYYRIRHPKYPHVLKADCEPSENIGRHF